MSIKITGKVSLPSSAPESIPNGSYFKVSFQDVSIMDGPCTVLGEREVSLTSYKKGNPIEYIIECPKPEHCHPFYTVSAVFNVGWKPGPNDNSWCRKGDFITDTMFHVDLQENKNEYKVDFHLIPV